MPFIIGIHGHRTRPLWEEPLKVNGPEKLWACPLSLCVKMMKKCKQYRLHFWNPNFDKFFFDWKLEDQAGFEQWNSQQW